MEVEYININVTFPSLGIPYLKKIEETTFTTINSICISSIADFIHLLLNKHRRTNSTILSDNSINNSN